MIPISIVTPVFNSKFLLKELWMNLKTQNYGELDWIVVNDGSVDLETLSVLEEIDKFCDFARVFHLENGGAPKARNYGFNQAKGAYVKFLDADDLLADDHLIRMATSMEQGNQFLVSPQKIMFDSGTSKHASELKRLDLSFFDNPIENSLYQFDFHHSSCFFSKALAAQIRWDESLSAYQDLDYLWNILLLSPSIKIVSDTHFINREHNYTERITTKRSPKKWQSRVFAVTKLAARLDWQTDHKFYKGLKFRYNTLFVYAFFEDRESAYMILREKKQVMHVKYDFDLLRRLIKEFIKKIIKK